MNKLKYTATLKVLLLFYWCSSLIYTDSYYSPYLAIGILGTGAILYNYKIYREETNHQYDRLLTEICAVILSLTVVLANYKMFTGPYTNLYSIMRKGMACILLIIGGYSIFREILCMVVSVRWLKGMEEKKHESRTSFFVIMFMSFVTVNLIVLFGAHYPGVLTADSISQMTQLLTHSYSNHHPYYHTQIIHMVICIGLWIFKDINKAIACYSVFSILVMACCFTYVLKTIDQIAKKRLLTIAVFLWYLIMPFHIMYSFTMWKDIFFGAVVTCFVVGIYRVLREFDRKRIDIFITVVSAVGICLLRSNGWVAFLVSTVVFVVLFGKKKKRWALTFFIILAFTFVLKHSVLQAIGVKQPDTIESLSIPAQQIARVVADGKPLSEEQKNLLNQVIEVERIPEVYTDFISDPVKNLVREKNNQEYLHTHRNDFIKLYLQLGLKYPHKYIEAWIDQTKGYWNGGYSYWKWADGIYDNSFRIQHTIYSSNINVAITDYLNLWETVPLLQLFLSIGFHVWILLITTYFSICRRNKLTFFITVPFLAIIFSLLIATPVAWEFRYIYSLFCGLPFVVVAVFGDEK